VTIQITILMNTLTLSAPALKHDALQQKCFMWAWNSYPHLRKLLWHTPNELPRRKGESDLSYLQRLNTRRAIGVVSGVLDLTFYYKGALHVFDIKVGNDRLSEDQELFIERVEAQGGKSYEVRTLEQFQGLFKSIIS
jgi:hypothetical protein